MFRNKILLRVAPSSSCEPKFFLLRLPLPSSGIPPLDLDLLCCKLSRRWRLACLPNPSCIHLIYQECQSRAVAHVVSELVSTFPGVSVGEEEEVDSGLLLASAVECGLRSFMLDHGWRCVGENIYVDSMFACSEERNSLRAVNVQVRSRRNDEFEFLVSPDAFRFSRHKISDLSSSKMMEQFKNGKEVDLEDCNILTTCTTLPALHEGHVIGFSKILPSGQHLDKFVELCSLKNGLAMDHDCYIVAKLNHGACLEKQWLPSSFVLQGSGLQPAPKSIRGSKAMSAMESFMELLKGWDFIGQNQLVIKEKLLLECSTTLPTWDKAKSNLTFRIARTDNSEDNDFNCTNFIAKGQPFILDFRTPKPAMVYSSSAKLSNTKVQEVALSSDYDNEDGMIAVTNYGCQAQPASACGLPLSTSSDKLASELESYVAQAQMLRPSFNRRKTAEKNRVTCSPEHDADSSQKQSCTSLLESSRESLLKTSHAGPVKSSSQSLLKPSHSGSHISSIELELRVLLRTRLLKKHAVHKTSCQHEVDSNVPHRFLIILKGSMQAFKRTVVMNSLQECYKEIIWRRGMRTQKRVKKVY